MRQFKKYDNSIREKEFNYKVDEVFQDILRNQDIFLNNIEEKIAMVTEGSSLSLITYGHTGSGKTHTIFGNKEEKGLINYCIEKLFNIDDNKDQLIIQIGAIEIYKEQQF